MLSVKRLLQRWRLIDGEWQPALPASGPSDATDSELETVQRALDDDPIHDPALMEAHRLQLIPLARKVPGLTSGQYFALIAAIEQDAVIDLYQHAAGDWVIELNHFPNSRGYCAPPWSQFLLTPERWRAVFLDVLDGEIYGILNGTGGGVA